MKVHQSIHYCSDNAVFYEKLFALIQPNLLSLNVMVYYVECMVMFSQRHPLTFNSSDSSVYKNPSDCFSVLFYTHFMTLITLALQVSVLLISPCVKKSEKKMMLEGSLIFKIILLLVPNWKNKFPAVPATLK